MHREDLETVAPLWYHFTREVRNDPEVLSLHPLRVIPVTYCQYITITVQAAEMLDLDKCISGELLFDDVGFRQDACLQAWILTGDGSGGSAGSRSWISEMYGYVQASSLSALQAV